jgi:hypothetical protein
MSDRKWYFVEKPLLLITLIKVIIIVTIYSVSNRKFRIGKRSAISSFLLLFVFFLKKIITLPFNKVLLEKVVLEKTYNIDYNGYFI